MANKNGIVIIPTFRLRGIDPTELFRDYLAGSFSNIDIPNDKIVIENIIPVVAPQYGLSIADNMYSIKDGISDQIIFATTNHKAYEMYTKSGGSLPTEGRCLWCRYDHKGSEMPGTIVAYKQKIFQVKIGEKFTIQKTHCFWTDNQCCDMECALAFDQFFSNLPPDKRESQFYDSEYLLRFLYSLQYPGSGPLIAAKDFRLLNINGGSLTYEQYKSTRHIYRKMPGMLLLPAKVSYIQTSV